MTTRVLIPTPGIDYSSKSQVLHAWKTNKKFMVSEPLNPDVHKKKLTRAEFTDVDFVEIKFNNLQLSLIIKVKQ